MTLSELAVKIKITGAEAVKRSVEGVGAAMKATGHAARGMGHVAAKVPAIFGAIASAASNPIAMMLQLAATAVTLTAALGVMASASAFQVSVKLDGLTRGLASVSTGMEDLVGQLASAKNLAKLPGLGFEEAIQGKIRLQSVGLAAQLADRSLMAFGNALATVGGGKAELDGVSTALSQMAAKGVVSAEEINQIAERVPQIRRAMIEAFGTADTEAIQKMGMDTTQFITGVVTELEKLPQITGSIGNDIENLGDRMKRMVEPLGAGLMVAFTAAQPAIEKFAAFLEERFTKIGEIIAATANSGVLAEVLERIAIAIDKAFGGDFTDGAITGISNLLSVVANLPQAFSQAMSYASALWDSLKTNASSVGTFLVELFSAIGQNIVASFEVVKNKIEQIFTRIGNGAQVAFAGYAKLMAPLLDALATIPMLPSPVRGAALLAADSLRSFKPSFTKVPQLGKDEGMFADLPKLPKLIGLPDLPKFDLLADSKRFAEMTTAAMKGLPTLPDGLNFGGGAQGAGVEGAGKKDVVEATLERIEQNTKSAADSLSLRRQALGGGELAGLGVTPAELSGGRASGGRGAQTRGNIGLDSSVSGLARSLDYITKRRVYETVNKPGGGGFRPRTG